MKKLAFCTGIFILTLGISLPAEAATAPNIAFPTDPDAVTFKDDFGEARAGHAHEGIDMIGPQMTPLYAAADGVVTYLPLPEPSWGYHLVIRDNEGYEYHYLHINNDTPGTDDGNGGVEHAFAPGISKGAQVARGQLVGWMGDSGNAEWVTDHLHFEIRKNDVPINPYESLLAASGGSAGEVIDHSDYTVQLTAQSPDINTEKGLMPAASAPCESGSLIKGKSHSAVYYCGADGKRYGFPNERIYFTWYEDFNEVETVSDETLASVTLGGNVTYRPGVRMVKLESIPNVYLIEPGGVLRWIKTPSLAASLYGADWAKKVDDLSDAYFTDYQLGADLETLSE